MKSQERTPLEFRGPCQQYKDVFCMDVVDISITKSVIMDINTGNSPPISQKQNWYPSIKICQLSTKRIRKMRD